jgi:probable phosphoglycerate mutase
VQQPDHGEFGRRDPGTRVDAHDQRDEQHEQEGADQLGDIGRQPAFLHLRLLSGISECGDLYREPGRLGRASGYPAAIAQPAASIYLARHGQTAYNLEGRFQGQQEIPLDDVGRAQAVELADRAAGYGFAALWSSPLLRARETAAAVAERIGLEPVFDARLMETDAGDWTDRSFAEVMAEAPQQFAAFASGDPAFAFPGGESFCQQEVRVTAALADVEGATLPALVVCHGMVIRAALASRARRRPARFERVPNAALVPLDPERAAHADLGGGAATLAS